MLGVVMYWTAIVIEPTYFLMDEARETQKNIEMLIDQGVSQNNRIIETQNNNTEKITDLLNQSRVILDNQIVLVRHLDNQTDQVTNQSNLLLLQGLELDKIIQFFRNNFNETFLQGEVKERNSTNKILNYMVDMHKDLSLRQHGINETAVNMLIEKQMRNWIAELQNNLSRSSLRITN